MRGIRLLGFARLLARSLERPGGRRAGSASLDEPSEAVLYGLLASNLPDTTIVSIGHRSTLQAFHQRHVAMVRDGVSGRAMRPSARREWGVPDVERSEGGGVHSSEVGKPIASHERRATKRSGAAAGRSVRLRE